MGWTNKLKLYLDWETIGKIALDTSTTTEIDEKLIEPDKFDEVATPELVEKVLFKSIFDTIGVTDDFYGSADPDDDQTAHIRDVNFDTSGITDFSYRNIFKSIVDTKPINRIKNRACSLFKM